MKNYSRPLHDNQLAFDFATRVLDLENSIQLGDQIQRVVTAEKLLQSTTAESTLNNKKNRHPYYYTDEARRSLREQVFSELAFSNRLDNDDEIKLGKGGATCEDLKLEGKAFIVIGLPASGKSSVASKIADFYNAAIIDSDFAKRKFPEYTLPQGATVVHEESIAVTFGSDSDNEPSVYEFFTNKKANIVIPKIGHDIDSVLGLRDALLKEGDSQYDEVHLILVSVDRKISTQRALNRFLKTDRYVPLGLVFDVYANDPTLTYYRVRDCKKWTTTGKVKTDGSEPTFAFGTSGGPAEILYGGQIV
ncbi:zeta toxin family protein [Vibrio harveyi]|uniref:zeta toxin family protein n=1 Tax=Vibrio harveyi group TaxID=717610 RepID=UPI003AAD106F